MAIVLTSLAFMVAALACMERLVRSQRATWAILPGSVMVAAWALLWWLRLPPTPMHALLAFTLADLAILGIATLAVVRLLGGFDASAPDDEADWRDGEHEPVAPAPHPSGPARAVRSRRSRRRPSRSVSGSRRSARGSGTRGPSRSSSGRTG